MVKIQMMAVDGRVEVESELNKRRHSNFSLSLIICNLQMIINSIRSIGLSKAQLTIPIISDKFSVKDIFMFHLFYKHLLGKSKKNNRLQM